MQHDLASMIKEKKLFLLDIDGTVALGSELLPGAADFLYTVKGKWRNFPLFYQQFIQSSQRLCRAVS